jgi:hypothetical protein
MSSFELAIGFCVGCVIGLLPCALILLRIRQLSKARVLAIEREPEAFTDALRAVQIGDLLIPRELGSVEMAARVSLAGCVLLAGFAVLMSFRASMTNSTKLEGITGEEQELRGTAERIKVLESRNRDETGQLQGELAKVIDTQNRLQSNVKVQSLQTFSSNERQLGLQVRSLQQRVAVAADKNEVASLADDTQVLHAELDSVKKDSEQQYTELAGAMSANQSQLTALSDTVKRKNHPFTISGVGSEVNVGGVRLRLLSLKPQTKQYDIAISHDSITIEKKNWYINEPIYLYVQGTGRVFEVLIQNISPNAVAGYLSKPADSE